MIQFLTAAAQLIIPFSIHALLSLFLPLCVLKQVSLSSAGSTACSQAQFLSSFHFDNDIYVNLFRATARHLERPIPLAFTLSFHFDQCKCMSHEHWTLDTQIDLMGGQWDSILTLIYTLKARKLCVQTNEIRFHFVLHCFRISLIVNHHPQVQEYLTSHVPSSQKKKIHTQKKVIKLKGWV